MEFSTTTPAPRITIPEQGTRIVYASYAGDKRHVYSDFSAPFTTSDCGWSKKARTPVIMEGHTFTDADRRDERTCKKCAAKNPSR